MVGLTTTEQKAVWDVPGAAFFSWQHRDDAWILYDSRSGHTQALNDFAREALACLEDEPLSLEGLCGEFAKFLEIPPSDSLREDLQEVIVDFDRKGLISPL